MQGRGAGLLGWLQAGLSGLGFGVGPLVLPAGWALQVGAALLWEAWAAGCFWVTPRFAALMLLSVPGTSEKPLKEFG